MKFNAARRFSTAVLCSLSVFALPLSCTVSATEPAQVDQEEIAEAAENAAFVGEQGYASVQDAINAIGDNGTGTIDLKQNSNLPAVIKAGQNITINVAAGVLWTNSEAAGNGENNSILINNGTLTLNNSGTLQADTVRPQTFDVINRYGATATINGGTFTSGHGDYLVRNYGTMTIDGNARFLKTSAGSPSMITNGWQYANQIPAGAKPADLTVNSCGIESTVAQSIGIKNDDNSKLVFNNGTIKTGFNIQNNNIAEINGGTFICTNTGGGNIANMYDNDTYNKADLTINGGDFYLQPQGKGTIIRNDGKGKITINGGTYYAEQDNVKNNVTPPKVLRQIPGSDRYEVMLPVSSISVTPSPVTVEEGSKVTLKADVQPKDATYPAVTWSVADKDKDTISIEGKGGYCVVTGLKEGTATITAAADGVKDDVTVTVTKKPVEISLKVTPDKSDLTVGNTLTLKAEATPAQTSGTITWKSSDPAIASVSEKGEVKALKPGQATITASGYGKEARAVITVKAKSDVIATIKLDPVSKEIDKGASFNIKAQVTPASSAPIKWSSSDASIASVDANGKVTGKKKGIAVITAEINGIKAECKVTVKDGTSAAAKPNTSTNTNEGLYIGLGVIALAAACGGYYFYRRKNKEEHNEQDK